MKIHWLSASLATLFLVAAPVLADDARTIQIRVDGDPEFDVVYHRAMTDLTGSVIAGFIGQGIQMGLESDRDAKKREEIKPHIATDVWQNVFVKTLNEALAAKGFAPTWVEGKQAKDAKAEVYLVLFPDLYGFRLVNSNSERVSAFVQFEAAYGTEPIKRGKNKEAFYLTDKKQALYEDLLKETSALNADVETVMAQAARRLANKIIYNVK